MPQLLPIQLDEDTTIYIEATENVQVPASGLNSDVTPAAEQQRTKKGILGNGNRGLITTYPSKDSTVHPETDAGTVIKATQNFKALEGTIRAYTQYTLNAFKEVATAQIDKVTLEFGIRVSGEAGIPYVTKGSAESNLNITVECSFKKSRTKKSTP